MKEILYTNLSEQKFARRYSKVVQEWDGTPFRVDMIRNFPPLVSDDDLWDLLRPIDRLTKQIEKQIGYRVVEMGNLIYTPAGAASGWNTNFEHYWQSDSDNTFCRGRPTRYLCSIWMTTILNGGTIRVAPPPKTRTYAAELSVTTNGPWVLGGPEMILPAEGNLPPTVVTVKLLFTRFFTSLDFVIPTMSHLIGVWRCL